MLRDDVRPVCVDFQVKDLGNGRVVEAEGELDLLDQPLAALESDGIAQALDGDVPSKGRDSRRALARAFRLTGGASVA
ncbi:hypothetical protein EJ065_3194 [Corallococcus coralloides]|uniref:Uncharacterized protein n=1 Tax=Corallococcus coralloides TaxID=184914 RepID=A0A410RS71_CORCK|nr:hypothetical protein [Corallococcus coralloides]QAT84760.1 hypothetical protein EJ065_3194 [Corallococcus coralloides]